MPCGNPHLLKLANQNKPRVTILALTSCPMEGCHVIIFISQNRNPNFPQTLACHRSFLLHPCTSFTATADEPTPAAKEQPSLHLHLHCICRNPNSRERKCTATCQAAIGQSNWSTGQHWSTGQSQQSTLVKTAKMVK